MRTGISWGRSKERKVNERVGEWQTVAVGSLQSAVGSRFVELYINKLQTEAAEAVGGRQSDEVSDK